MVIFYLLWSEFVETNAMFRSASTDLDHAFVSTNSLQSKLNISINLARSQLDTNYVMYKVLLIFNC